MHKKLDYISPSSFFFWEKCPLKALFSKTFRDKQIFPKHPDAALGTLIHKFYEKQREWNINSLESFNVKWKIEIDNINESYKSDALQMRYYPVQWHSKFYVVKKKLLYANLINGRYQKEESTKDNSVFFEKWINNKYLGGHVDLIINNGGKVKQIVDFKTGNIFEIINNKKIIKEIYKQQLSLYCAIIIENQTELPELFLEAINGKRYLIDIDIDYVEKIASRALGLKQMINDAVEIDKTDSLAKCSIDNCNNCNYRMFCSAYKNSFTNERCGNKIDLQGTINKIGNTEIRFDTGIKIYIIKNVEILKSLTEGEQVSIYNLFYPNEEEPLLYCLNNTVVYNG